MNLILKNAKIIDPESDFYNQVIDIEISNGMITNLAKNISQKNNYTIIEKENLHVSCGWLDTCVVFGEPGFETTETIKNGLETAAKSGFTTVFVHSNTNPAIDNQAVVQLINSKAANFATQLKPIGCLTQNAEGEHLAELFDMKNAGAVAFGDYKNKLNNINLLKISFQYTADINAMVMLQPMNANLKGKGIVNEGEIATKLGLKGMPAIAEEIALENAISLLEYTNGKLHIPIITTKKSVEIIKKAKAKNLQITCGTSVNHLVLTDGELIEFNSNTKIYPPLRTEIDRQALIDAVNNNIIDVITSDHCPVNIEDKHKEFDLASYGSIGLESAFGALNTILSVDKIIEKFNSQTIFGLEKQTIKVGNSANLTLFNPEGNWVFEKANISSFSKNSIMLQKNMKGKVYGIVNQDKLVL